MNYVGKCSEDAFMFIDEGVYSGQIFAHFQFEFKRLAPMQQ